MPGIDSLLDQCELVMVGEYEVYFGELIVGGAVAVKSNDFRDECCYCVAYRTQYRVVNFVGKGRSRRIESVEVCCKFCYAAIEPLGAVGRQQRIAAFAKYLAARSSQSEADIRALVERMDCRRGEMHAQLVEQARVILEDRRRQAEESASELPEPEPTAHPGDLAALLDSMEELLGNDPAA